MSKLKVTKSPTGLRRWDLPQSELYILWLGPGCRLSLCFGDAQTSIQHPTASGTYQTEKEATAAVEAFVRSCEEDRTNA